MKISKKQTKYVFAIAITLLFLLAVTSNISAFRDITVSGHVVNDRTGSGTGIGPVKIKVYTGFGEYVKTEYTDNNGYYSFQVPLILESYELRFSKSGEFSPEEYMLRERPEPVRLIPYIDYVVDVDFTYVDPTNSIPKGYDVPLSFSVKNKDNYYTLTNLALNVKIKSTRWLFDPSAGYTDFDGWLKISLDFSIIPGQTKSDTKHIPTMFRLYDSADTSQTSLGLFALNYGEYQIEKYALTGASTHDGRITGAFYSDQTSQTDLIDIIKVSYMDYNFVFALYDSWWRSGDGDNWEGTGYAPSWFFFTGEDNNVNDKFYNQFQMKYKVYNQIFYQETGRPTTDSGWIDLAKQTLAPDFLGLSSSWANAGSSEWLRVNNHGFDTLALFVGEIGDHWGYAALGGNYLYMFIDRPGWAGEIDNDEIDNLIQHELSHNFDAIDHEGIFNPASVMTYYNFPGGYFLNQDNWLDQSYPFNDVTVMENAISSYWIYRGTP